MFSHNARRHRQADRQTINSIVPGIEFHGIVIIQSSSHQTRSSAAAEKRRDTPYHGI